jgi:hypothetical protein
VVRVKLSREFFRSFFISYRNLLGIILEASQFSLKLLNFLEVSLKLLNFAEVSLKLFNYTEVSLKLLKHSTRTHKFSPSLPPCLRHKSPLQNKSGYM